MLRCVRDALSSAGYMSIVTGDPEGALRLVEEEMPDLVLLYLVSPGTDGIKLMKDISERATCRLSSPSTCDRDELIAGPSIWGRGLRHQTLLAE